MGINGHSGKHQRRQLVDERLAASRRHDDERVAPFEDGVDRRPLTLLEILMAKSVNQNPTRPGLR